MKQITIEISKEQIEEILPIISLQMRALEMGGNAEQLEAINAFSPKLVEIYDMQKRMTTRFDSLFASEDLYELQEKIDEITEEMEFSYTYPIELPMAARASYTSLFLGEIIKQSEAIKDPVQALALVTAGSNLLGEFTIEDSEMAEYWTNLSETLTNILDEQIEKNKDLLPELSAAAQQVSDLIKEFYEETKE